MVEIILLSYIATTNDNVMENIKRYIENQGNEDIKKG